MHDTEEKQNGWIMVVVQNPFDERPKLLSAAQSMNLLETLGMHADLPEARSSHGPWRTLIRRSKPDGPIWAAVLARRDINDEQLRRLGTNHSDIVAGRVAPPHTTLRDPYELIINLHLMCRALNASVAS